MQWRWFPPTTASTVVVAGPKMLARRFMWSTMAWRVANTSRAMRTVESSRIEELVRALLVVPSRCRKRLLHDVVVVLSQRHVVTVRQPMTGAAGAGASLRSRRLWRLAYRAGPERGECPSSRQAYRRRRRRCSRGCRWCAIRGRWRMARSARSGTNDPLVMRPRRTRAVSPR